MAFLYISNKGLAWRKHSYSAGRDFAQSPMKYYYRRVLGWRQKDNKGSFKFGRALESAIQYFHETGFERESGVEEFIRLWAVHKEETDITYTKTEKSWDNLLRVGTEMMKLYAIKRPELPLTANSVFQREYSKEVFVGDAQYGEIEDAGKIDLISYPDPNHPMLPKVSWEKGVVRPLIVDIKTSGVDYTDIAGECAHDGQLRRYAWLTGIQDVAFLWFKKCSHGKVKGSSCTLLEDADDLKAGQEVVVANVNPDGIYIVRNDFFITEMEAAQGRKDDGKLDTTKAATERKNLWLAQNAILVQEAALTRQRLQFNCGRVSVESMNDAGYIAADQIQGIVNCWKRKHWPNKFDPRPPGMDMRDPYYVAFVRDDKMYRDANFVQKIDDELDLFSEEPEAEGEQE